MRCFECTFVISINRLLNPQSCCWWFDKPWRARDVTVMKQGTWTRIVWHRPRNPLMDCHFLQYSGMIKRERWVLFSSAVTGGFLALVVSQDQSLCLTWGPRSVDYIQRSVDLSKSIMNQGEAWYRVSIWRSHQKLIIIIIKCSYFLDRRN